MMRVAVVCHSFVAGISGVETAIVDLVRNLQKRSCAVTVFCAFAEPNDKLAGVKYTILRTLRKYYSLSMILSYEAAWQIFNIIHQGDLEQFDVVYGSSPLFGCLAVASVHFHSCDWVRTLRARSLWGDGWRVGLRLAYKRLLHEVLAAMERRAYRRVRETGRPFLMPVSNAVAESLRTYHGLPATAMKVVPNPVEFERFHPGHEPELWEEIRGATGWGENAFVCLFAGLDWFRKGLNTVVEALAQLPERVKLVVVGSSDLTTFEAMASRLGVRERIHFAGWRKDIERFYRLSNVFVYPSRYETFAIVCVEALASGLPVLVGPFDAAHEWLEEGVNGFTVANVDAVVARLTQFVEDPDLLGQMSSNARPSVERFGRAAVMDEVLGIFAECAQSRKQRGGGVATRRGASRPGSWLQRWRRIRVRRPACETRL